MQNIHKIFSIITALILIVFVNFFPYQKSFAAVPSFTPFGGKTVQQITPCVGGTLLTIVGLPLPLFLPVTLPVLGYAPLVPLIPVNSLGLFIPGGVCTVGLITYPVLGTIILVGISLPFTL